MGVGATEKAGGVPRTDVQEPRRARRIIGRDGARNERRFDDPFRDLGRRFDDLTAVPKGGIRGLLVRAAAVLSSDLYPRGLPSVDLLARIGIDTETWKVFYRTLRLNTVDVEGLDMNALRSDRGYTVDASGRNIIGRDIEKLLGQIEGMNAVSGLAKHGALLWAMWTVGKTPDLGDYNSVIGFVDEAADRYGGEEVHSMRAVTVVYDYSDQFRNLVNEIVRLHRRGVSELAGLYETASLARYLAETGREGLSIQVMKRLNDSPNSASHRSVERALYRLTYQDPPVPENQVAAAILHRVQAFALLRTYEDELGQASSGKIAEVVGAAALHVNKARNIVAEMVEEPLDPQLEVLRPLSLGNDMLHRTARRAWNMTFQADFPTAMWTNVSTLMAAR